jgi:L-rhamnose isomerase/sugar isomerase
VPVTTFRDDVKQALRQQWVETPSWAYGNTGTRFKVFRWPGAARDAYEKIEDAAVVHRLTGVSPAVALSLPWDRVDDYGKLAKHAADMGMRVGAIGPNLAHVTGVRARCR